MSLDPLLLLGIVGGLLAAAGQAFSYLVSRHFLDQDGRSSVQLLILANVWMGVFALPVLPLVWRAPSAGWGGLLIGLVLTLLGYLAAQGIFFATVRTVPASRIAPLLGIKIAFVAIFAQILGTEQLDLQHWIAVALTALAAVAIQRSAEPVPLRGLLGILAIAACFAVSDSGIAVMNRALGPDDTSLARPLFILTFTHVTLLPLALAAAAVRRPLRQPWLPALPYALLWFGSMVALFVGIVFAGVVLAVICQSMRGPFSLLIALLVARLGWHHLEVPQGRAVFIRQFLAALVMVVAIIVYGTAG